jgi:hypothetical protein
MVYVTEYVPAVLELGVICPVLEFIVKPDGLTVYVPPDVPVCVTDWVLAVVHQGDPV